VNNRPPHRGGRSFQASAGPYSSAQFCCSSTINDAYRPRASDL